jgi:hypothetical protein
VSRRLHKGYEGLEGHSVSSSCATALSKTGKRSLIIETWKVRWAWASLNRFKAVTEETSSEMISSAHTMQFIMVLALTKVK